MRVLARTLATAVVGSARALSRSTASLSHAPTVALNDGTRHPQIGFGTYKVGFIPASASAVFTGKMLGATTRMRATPRRSASRLRTAPPSWGRPGATTGRWASAS